MAILSIDTISEGMVLMSDVRDRSGRLLLECGTEINAKHLRMFRTWGITEADIVTVDGHADGPASAAADPELLRDAENALRPLFCNANLSYPAMGELFRLSLLRKVRNESR